MVLAALSIMTVSLATAFAVMILVAVTAFAATTITSTASTALVTWRILFFVGSLSHVNDFAGVLHCFASKLVVEVDSNSIVGNLLDDTLDAHSVASHHGYEGPFIYTVTVELTLDDEE